MGTITTTKTKAQRAADAARQARYRERHLNSPETVDAARINQVVTLQAKAKLERLARHYGLSQRGLLEKLLADAEDVLSDQPQRIGTQQLTRKPGAR